jgi:hypothetical protein
LLPADGKRELYRKRAAMNIRRPAALSRVRNRRRSKVPPGPARGRARGRASETNIFHPR